MDMLSRSSSLSNDQELYHFSFRKHWEKKDHKYIKKIPTPKGFRYVYDLPKKAYKIADKQIDDHTNKKLSDLKNTENGGALLALGLLAVSYPLVKKVMDMSYKKLIENKVSDFIKDNAKKDDSEYDHLTTREYQEKLNTLDRQKIRTDKAEDQRMINENYPKPGYTENCASCTLAYDLRQRGYDVVANSAEHGESASDILNWYEPEAANSYEFKATTFPALDAKQLENKLNEYPDGARGFFMVRWYGTNSGHAMVWEKVNGKIIIRDCQNGETHTIKQALMYTSSYEVFRTDNVEPNDKCFERVKNRRA